MKIKLVGSSIPDVGQYQFATSYLLNQDVAIDAGSIGFLSSLEVQSKIQHVFLSHSHIDHIGSLPLFLDNVYRPGPECVTVYGSQAVLDCLRDHVFNELVWPDLERLSTQESPFLRFQLIENGKTVRAAGLDITPVEVNHVVPTHGFLVEDGASAVAILSDTGATDEIWRVAGGKSNLKAVFLEACFPNSMAWLAEKSKHLTPDMFRTEYEKLKKHATVVAVHIKANFRTEVVRELKSLGLPSLQIGRPEVEYEF